MATERSDFDLLHIDGSHAFETALNLESDRIAFIYLFRQAVGVNKIFLLVNEFFDKTKPS